MDKFKSLLNLLAKSWGVLTKPRSIWTGEVSRFDYQKSFHDFNILKSDIGSMKFMPKCFTKLKPALNFVFSLFKKDVPFLVDDPVFAFRGNPNYPGHDKNGYRNKTIPSRVDLLAVGDSQVYGITVSSTESWPQMLSAITQLSIYNASIGGWGVPQFSLAMEQQLSMRPQNVLVGIYIGQSIYKSLIYVLKSTSDYARSYWRNHYASLPLVDFTYYENNKNIVVEKILKSNLDYTRAQALKICEADGVLDCNSVRIGSAKFYLEDTYRFLIQNIEHPAIGAALEISKDAIIKMRELARMSNIMLSIILIPTKEYLVYLRRDDASIKNIGTLVRLGENEELLSEDLKNFCTNMDIACYDPSNYLAQRLEDGIYWQDSDDGHPTALGCTHIASYLAKKIFNSASESFA